MAAAFPKSTFVGFDYHDGSMAGTWIIVEPFAHDRVADNFKGRTINTNYTL
jgi:hypothetical protein